MREGYSFHKLVSESGWVTEACMLAILDIIADIRHKITKDDETEIILVMDVFAAHRTDKVKQQNLAFVLYLYLLMELVPINHLIAEFLAF